MTCIVVVEYSCKYERQINDLCCFLLIKCFLCEQFYTLLLTYVLIEVLEYVLILSLSIEYSFLNCIRNR